MSAIAIPAEIIPKASAEPPVAVSATNLVRRYGEGGTSVEALRGVSLDVADGKLTAIMGPSGSGKSTLMHILAGLDRPTSGSVLLDGIEITNLSDKKLTKLRREKIGFVFQFFNLLPNLTAAENVALPLRLRNEGSRRHRDGGVSPRNINERVSLLMDQLNLHGLQGHGPEEISGGEQQRVAIARALAAAPALLLADEPTGNLDWTTGHEVMDLLGRLCRSQQQTAVLVSHDARVAAHADRVLVMRDGEIVDEVRLTHGDEAGTPAAVGILVERLGKLDL
jgi:putative ABC transport system ATP-binding protein